MKVLQILVLCFLGLQYNSDDIGYDGEDKNSFFDEFLQKDTQTSLDALETVTHTELKQQHGKKGAAMFLIYSDNCTECMQMATQLISIKTQLNAESIKLSLFKINIRKEHSVSDEYFIIAVPDLIVVNNDSHCILRDNIPTKNMKEWISRVLYPNSVEINDMSDADSAITQKGRVIVIAYVGESAYHLEHILRQLNCHSINLNYYIVRSDEIAKALGYKLERSLHTYREGKLSRSWYFEAGKRLDLAKMKTYLLHSHEPVSDYFDAYEHEYKLDKTITYFYTKNEDPTDVLKLLSKLAEEYFQKIRFFHVKITPGNIKKLGRSFKFTKHYPLIINLNSHYSNYVFPRNTVLTEDNVRMFIKDALVGKLKKYTGSENIFRLKTEGSRVLKFSSSLLNTLTRLNFTLLLIHVEQCSLCDTVASHFESLAEEHKYETEYVLGTYNYYENYYEYFDFKDDSFPKVIALFGYSKYVIYKGDLTFDDLDKWITSGVPGEVVDNDVHSMN